MRSAVMKRAQRDGGAQDDSKDAKNTINGQIERVEEERKRGFEPGTVGGRTNCRVGSWEKTINNNHAEQ